MEKEERFLIPKTKEEQLENTLEFLDSVSFNFACFVDSFKKYLEKANIIDKSGKAVLGVSPNSSNCT